MAEKYNLPGPGTRPLFFRHPLGVVVPGSASPWKITSQPAAVLNGPAAVPVSVIGTHQH